MFPGNVQLQVPFSICPRCMLCFFMLISTRYHQPSSFMSSPLGLCRLTRATHHPVIVSGCFHGPPAGGGACPSFTAKSRTIPSVE
ncbi:unnamed protein product [Haemonchus placei]|uniref:Secreted protein n=1 Tax=Haemonchus placei TaxID=6290 RepID=A0A0N4X134_HAEPC|nr:unnamed protein product [Haemonchus placei]